MKIYDMHIHASVEGADSTTLIQKMEEQGVYGGAVYSLPPLEAMDKPSADYDERIKNVMAWTEGYPGRLFPVLWIHPDEKDLEAKLRDSVSCGIVGFKFICDNYYVYDEKCMKILRKIAEMGKPVIFHSGILWDGAVSSKYNRPVNWEELLTIPGLKFALAHCSWPWYDECIALYGKILCAHRRHPELCEMFFDLTPGTPRIYREDLLFKLHRTGYNVENNILFGSDAYSGLYRGGARSWYEYDNCLYEKIGVPESVQQKIYADNFLRFIGAEKQ